MYIYRIILTTGESFSDSSPSKTIVLHFFKKGLNIFDFVDFVDFVDFTFGYDKVSLLFYNVLAKFILTAGSGSDSSSSDEVSFFRFFFGTNDFRASAALAIIDVICPACVVLLIMLRVLSMCR